MRKPTLADFDHPLVFLFFLTLALVPTIALIGLGLQKLNLSGPAALFGAASA